MAKHFANSKRGLRMQFVRFELNIHSLTVVALQENLANRSCGFRNAAICDLRFRTLPSVPKLQHVIFGQLIVAP